MILVESIKKCFKVIDDFTIKFNINAKESVRNENIIMKNIENLSLGQKVVAILTFVFNFGLEVNDNTPLIIDQPEDNLDNQYIFRNLVKSLKMIKNNRQVILVTHSSTIVTNANAEQVIVMSSDNERGWIEKTGYPSDKVVTKYIINNLEGGIESFKHKMDNYLTILNDLVS
jgi:predicted ATP-dependent endonuclease of OLD family